MRHATNCLRFMFLAILLCLACPACHGSGPQSGAEPPAVQDAGPGSTTADNLAAVFAPPSELMALLEDQRRASYVEADLTKAGEGFNPLLPNNRATAGAGVIFDPAWSGTTASELAYCMYQFSIPGYDRNAQIRPTWSTPPPTIGNAWVGLGNWGPDTWDWYKCNAGSRIELQEIDPYIAFGGAVLLCVAVVGTDGCTLDEVRIGTELPIAYFSPARTRGFAPLVIDFDADSSSDPDGSITKYEWDLDGDGTFEVDGGLTPTTSYEYTAPGSYNPALRVTDNDGMTSVRVGEIGAADEFVHTWGAAGSDTTGGVAADQAGNIFQVGGTYLQGAGSSAQIVKFSPAGQLVWNYAFDGLADEIYKDIAIGADGEVYVCGSTSSFGAGLYDGLLQCWSPAGELVWSRVWGNAGDDIFNAMAVSGSNIYVVGHGDVTDKMTDALLFKFDQNGDLIWEKRFGGLEDDFAYGIDRSKPLMGDPTLHVVGAAKSDPGIVDFDLMYFTFTEAGSVIDRKTFGDENAQAGINVIAPKLFDVDTIIVGHSSPLMLSFDFLAISVNGNWAKYLDSEFNETCTDFVKLPDSEFLMSGMREITFPGSRDAMLFTFNASGAGISLEMRDFEGQLDMAAALCAYTDGVVVAGDAPDTTGTWAQHFFELKDHGGEWKSISWGIMDADGTVQDANGSVITVTGAVLDTGGGDSDLLCELRGY